MAQTIQTIQFVIYVSGTNLITGSEGNEAKVLACPSAPPEAASSLLHTACLTSVSSVGDPFASITMARKARGCAACAPGSPKHETAM